VGRGESKPLLLRKNHERSRRIEGPQNGLPISPKNVMSKPGFSKEIFQFELSARKPWTAPEEC